MGQIDKEFGYTEIQLSDRRVPVKIGTYAMEELCKDFSIELYEMPGLFFIKEVELEGKMVQSEIPRNITKFLRSVLLHGANWVCKVNGQDLYTEKDAYEWLDQIGFGSKDAFNVILLFMGAFRSGRPIKSPTQETAKKKGKGLPGKSSGIKPLES
jgi:hypothetical protein